MTKRKRPKAIYIQDEVFERLHKLSNETGIPVGGVIRLLVEQSEVVAPSVLVKPINSPQPKKPKYGF